jgi:hypothetical protein
LLLRPGQNGPHQLVPFQSEGSALRMRLERKESCGCMVQSWNDRIMMIT